MQTTTKIILAVCSIGAVAIGTLTPANAQYYPPQGYSPLPLPGDDGAAGFRYYHHLTWDGCPPGWTVQGHQSLRSGIGKSIAHAAKVRAVASGMDTGMDAHHPVTQYER